MNFVRLPDWDSVDPEGRFKIRGFTNVLKNKTKVRFYILYDNDKFVGEYMEVNDAMKAAQVVYDKEGKTS